MRLIDVDALLEADPEVCADYGPEYGIECGYSREQILNAPTVDAVPVVRCRDCKHWDSETKFPYCWYRDDNVEANDYCSKGERKGGGV